MSQPALYIKDLKKTYEGGLQALKGIDLEVEKGDFFALLGPNGAGKSTTINIIIDLVNKTSGKVEVFGNDIDTQREEAKKYIGVVPQEFNFNIFEKVFDIVVQQGGYYGIPKDVAQKRAEKYLKKLELWEKKDAKAMTLSGGLKRRLMIARALVHEPEVLILDEPTAGVDIEIRRSMWKFISELNTGGRTIILTTHYLEEAESLCRNVAIINHGEIVENTSMKDLLKKLDKETFVLDLKEPLSKLPDTKGHIVRKRDSTTLEVDVSKTDDINHIFKWLDKNKIEVLSMRNKSNRLEELFIDLVEKGKKK